MAEAGRRWPGRVAARAGRVPVLLSREEDDREGAGGLGRPATVLGSGMTNIMLAIGISNVPYFARLARSMAISIRGREYIESAVTTGLNHFEIITRYVLPNMSSVIIVQTSLSAASALITESTLSFMGVGVQPPAASLGVLLRDGYDYISKASWLSIFPGIAILLTVIALNFLGDGLRDALDVKIRVDN